MTDSNPPKSPEEGAGKPEALEVTQHAEHPLEAELRDPAAGKPAPVAPASAQAQPSGWEREVLEKVLMATVREQRAARRWRIFFRFVSLGIVGLILWAFASFEGETVSTGRHTAVVNLDGEIAANTNASAENINASLEAAFADDNTVGVILKINSPGGSPVQAGMTTSAACVPSTRTSRCTWWWRRCAPRVVTTWPRRLTKSMSTRPASLVRSAC